MFKRITGGAFGRGPIGRIGDTLRKGRFFGIGGEKIHINKKQEEKIIDAATKVYGKSSSIRGDEFQRNITNALVAKNVIDSKEAVEVEKSLGLDKKYTKQVGYKYFDALKHEKALASQNQPDAAAEIGKVNKFERTENRFGRLEKMLGSMKANRFGENGNSSGQMAFDKLPGKMINKTPDQKGHDSHHGGISASGASPMHDVTPSSDIDA